MKTLQEERIPYNVHNTFVTLADDDHGSRSEGLRRCSSESSLQLDQDAPSPAELRTYSNNSSRTGSYNSSQCSSSKDLTKSDNSNMKVSADTLALCDRLLKIAMAENSKRSNDVTMPNVNDLAASKSAKAQVRDALDHLIPTVEGGNKLSMGSILHFLEPTETLCKPCWFWSRGRCSDEGTCTRCHCDHKAQNDRSKQDRRHLDRRRKIFEQVAQTKASEAPGSGYTSQDDSSVGTELQTMTSCASEPETLTPREDPREAPTPEAMDFYQRAVVRKNNNLRVLSSMVTDHDLKEHVPLDVTGSLTSIGSIMHYLKPAAEHCKPCVFWMQPACKNGPMCAYCHVFHSNQQFKKLRASRNTRNKEREAKLGRDNTGCSSVASTADLLSEQSSPSNNRRNSSSMISL